MTEEVRSEPAPLRGLVVGAVAGAVAEGGSALSAGLRGGIGTGASIVAGLLAFGIVALPALGAALLVYRVLAVPRVASIATRAATRIGGGATISKRAAVRLLASIAVGAALAVAAAAFHRFAENAPSKIVALAYAAGVFVVTAAALAAACLWLGPRVGKFFDDMAPEGSELAPYVNAVLAALGAGAITAGFARFLPPSFMWTPGVALLGAAFPEFPGADELAKLLPRRRPLLLGTLAIAAGVYVFFGRAPAAARRIAFTRTPYSGAAITLTRWVVDFDRDGFAPILAGGDCNDFDKTIHPGAIDIPGNGIDENCSGSDGKPFHPPVQPPFETPDGLPQRPSFVLVQLDAMRPDRLHFAGGPRENSPNLDRFAAASTWFSRAYTPAPSTRFAMAAMFSGLEVDRVPQLRSTKLDFEMLPRTPTFASLLGSAGYDRIGWTISYVMQHIDGVGGGFRTWNTPWPTTEWEANEPDAATHTTDAGIRSLGELGGSKPFLLFLHYRCTHDPYSAKDRWAYGQELLDQYDSAAAYCDDEVGRLMKTIDARADAKKLVVVIFSDHGELFGEHGLVYHGNSLYEPDVRALLLARIPGIAPSRIDAPVSLLDLHPTILALAGLPRQTDRPGWNLLPLAAGGDRAPSDGRPLFLYAEGKHGIAKHESRAVVRGSLKVIRDLSTGGIEMFDVLKDPAEENDLSLAMPEVQAELVDELDAWESAAPRH
ncbi:MAG TPA: sulfatase-like hydrolase/transferase [Labilithrix sp.]